MNSKHILGIFTLSTTLVLAACGPKDADINNTVSSNVSQVATGVTAQVSDGVVTLTGQVKDESAKVAAEDAAKKVAGVNTVTNNITVVAPEAPTVVSDYDRMRQAVTDATKDYPNAFAMIHEGEITVTGEVTANEWKKLKKSLDSLQPKKIDISGLKIK